MCMPSGGRDQANVSISSSNGSVREANIRRALCSRAPQTTRVERRPVVQNVPQKKKKRLNSVHVLANKTETNGRLKQRRSSDVGHTEAQGHG